MYGVTKGRIKSIISQPERILKFENGAIFFEDDLLKVFPIEINGDKDSCFSYVCEPKVTDHGAFNL